MVVHARCVTFSYGGRGVTRSRACAILRLASRRVYFTLILFPARRGIQRDFFADRPDVESLALHRAPVGALTQKRDYRLRPPEGVYLPVAEVLQDAVEGEFQEVAPAGVALQAQLLQKDGRRGEERPQADGGEEEGEGEGQVQVPEGETEHEGDVAEKLDHRAQELEEEEVWHREQADRAV